MWKFDCSCAYFWVQFYIQWRQIFTFWNSANRSLKMSTFGLIGWIFNLKDLITFSFYESHLLRLGHNSEILHFSEVACFWFSQYIMIVYLNNTGRLTFIIADIVCYLNNRSIGNSPSTITTAVLLIVLPSLLLLLLPLLLLLLLLLLLIVIIMILAALEYLANNCRPKPMKI